MAGLRARVRGEGAWRDCRFKIFITKVLLPNYTLSEAEEDGFKFDGHHALFTMRSVVFGLCMARGVQKRPQKHRQKKT
jgi:hypothetical protein